MSWHTYYRPHQVSDLHLSDVRELLQKLMKSGGFPQVFLCAGPKGTGKTSTARIIGAMLNDPANATAVDSLFFTKKKNKPADSILIEPDASTDLSQVIFDGQSFTVQEMDAASNRGIDDVRQLKERVALPPQEGKMAVYILDEVHMLTNEAFNALLKLLEEPPAHAVFVLATTEVHKVPATIQSRCVVLPFRKATIAEIAAALERVAQLEKLTLKAGAPELIARLADGSFRDAIKSLELVATASGATTITEQLVNELLNTRFEQQLPELVQALVDKQETTVVKIIEQLRSQGVSSTVVQKALVHFLHQDLLRAVEVEPGVAQFSSRVSHFLLQELNQMPSQSAEALPLLTLEVKLLELIYRSQDKTNGVKDNGSNSSGKASSNPAASKSAVKEQVKTSIKAAPEMPEIPEMPKMSSITQITSVAESDSDIDTKPLLQEWAAFVDLVTQKNSTLGAFLRSAKPLIEESNGTAKIEVYYKFHRDQLVQPKFLAMLQDCAEPLLSGRPMFEFIVATRSEAALADEVLM